MLPTFVWAEAFEYLPRGECRRLRLVCRRWNGVLVPLVFRRISATATDSQLRDIVRRYGRYVDEISVDKLDSATGALLSGCRWATRLTVRFHADTRVDQVLGLGERLMYLRHLGLENVDPSLLVPLQALTRRVRSVSYKPALKEGLQFRDYFVHLVCPLARGLAASMDFVDHGEDFPFVVRQCPSLRALDFTSDNLEDSFLESFSYDVTARAFRRVAFTHPTELASVEMYFKAPPPKPHASHEAQFRALLSLRAGETQYPNFLASFPNIAAVSLASFDREVAAIEHLLHSLKDSPLFAVWLPAGCPIRLPPTTFLAESIYLGPTSLGPTDLYGWLATWFPNLQEIYISQASPFNEASFRGVAVTFPALVTVNSKVDFSLDFWHQLVGCSPLLAKVLLPAASSLRDQLQSLYPSIFFGHYREPRHDFFKYRMIKD